METRKEKVLLRQEEETLLITLCAKTIAAPKGILEDPAAWKLLEQIDYDFSKLHVPNGTRSTVVLRAKKIDSVVRDFLARHPDGVVLHLGCGLDTRFTRVDNGQVIWYDLDLPAVIDLRAKFFEQTPRYRMLASSASDMKWIEQVQAASKPVLVAAEGLMIAGMLAAYVSTISTHLNWGSSYVVNDFYKRFVNPGASEKKLVSVGRWSTILMMAVAAVVAKIAREDVHLGKLARLLRMAGFDCRYDNSLDDATIIFIAQQEHRIILTRDIGLLKHSAVTHGYWVRSLDPIEQAREVLHRFDLWNQVEPFRRCLVCNGLVEPVSREVAAARLPPYVMATQDAIFGCPSCRRLYWRGTHYDRMRETLARILEPES